MVIAMYNGNVGAQSKRCVTCGRQGSIALNSSLGGNLQLLNSWILMHAWKMGDS
jgi:hypothetical protein